MAFRFAGRNRHPLVNELCFGCCAAHAARLRLKDNRRTAIRVAGRMPGINSFSRQGKALTSLIAVSLNRSPRLTWTLAFFDAAQDISKSPRSARSRDDAPIVPYVGGPGQI